MKFVLALATLATASAFTTTGPFLSKGMTFASKPSTTYLNVAS